MKKSTIWLIVGIGALVLAGIVGCCALGSTGDDSTTTTSATTAGEVNLEELAKAYKRYIKKGNKDINGFERIVNSDKDIYKGSEPVRVTIDDKGQVVGYKNKDNKPGYDKAADEMVFTLNAEKDKKRIVATDRRRRHYGLSAGDIFGLYLISRMLDTQRSYYGGRYYRAPRSGNWVRSGYYRRSRSVRSGSRGRSRSRGGGFGFGK